MTLIKLLASIQRSWTHVPKNGADFLQRRVNGATESVKSRVRHVVGISWRFACHDLLHQSLLGFKGNVTRRLSLTVGTVGTASALQVWRREYEN